MRTTPKERFIKFAKGRQRLNIWLDEKLSKRFTAASKACGISKAELMRQLIECYLERVESAKFEH